jgi:hypothetical protein
MVKATTSEARERLGEGRFGDQHSNRRTGNRRRWAFGAALIAAAGAVFVASRGANAGDGPVPPPDGKYENVMVEGRLVPMIEVMEHGDVVLVDTDGKKPRTWEEQLKRKGNIPSGSYDVHKTNVDGAANFANEPIDRKGLWAIDARGNITAVR